jgi:hypothetical protein
MIGSQGFDESEIGALLTGPRPLQNRVLPTGEIVAIPARGLFMGNRGGRIHDPQTRELTRRRWASRRWICCVTDFKNRQREVMGPSYTELFFLDEVTALASGHRPCFECRRPDAKAFQAAFSSAQKSAEPLPVDAMDRVLHEDRLQGRQQRTFAAPLAKLPAGTMVWIDGRAHALHEKGPIAWTSEGYVAAISRKPETSVVVLTPKCICAAIATGYRPHWHPSAEQAAG